MGVCMFAIDCLKVNGTHLGTCIDRFYFGSCCLIEPVNEILDNRIETELLDEREPPMRITNTTAKPIASTEKLDSNVNSIENKFSNQSSTIETYSQTESSKNPMKSSTTTHKTPVSTTYAPVSESSAIIFGQKLTPKPTTAKVELTTVAQKLQTFQVVDGSTLADSTTQSSNTYATTKTKKPITTTGSTSRPVTSKPTRSKPTPTKPSSVKPTTRKSTAKPKPTKPSGE